MTLVTPRRIAHVLIASLFLVSCTAPTDGGTSPPTSSTRDLNTEVTVIAEDLDAPWSIAFYRETPLVSERDSARVLELDEDFRAREVAVIGGVEPRGEGGLLGIAVHDGYLYTYFTTGEDNRIERHLLLGEPGSLTLGERASVIAGIPAASNHNGGRIAFGPDGMLYVTTGDAGRTELSQDLDSLAGKILRMTPEGEAPGDNPFPGTYVYSYGHRNPQGIAWDEEGTMYSTEFGQNTWDELNVIEPGSNYGWPTIEGIAEETGFVDPVQQWEPADASPSGMAITGGHIWVANLRGELLRNVPLNDLSEASDYWVGEYGRLRDVVVAPDGALWVVTNNTDGRGDPRAGDDRILRFPTTRSSVP